MKRYIRLGRLSFFFQLSFYLRYIVGVCGCRILVTPLGVFEWQDKLCVCDACKQYVCQCTYNDFGW